MSSIYINSFLLLFVAIDPLGFFPLFVTLTEDAKIKQRNQIAIKSIFIALVIMISFAYVGRYLLDAIEVSLDSVKIAGGIVLMFLAIDILFEKRKRRREKRVERALEESSYDDIIVFPLAIPLIAGPSALTAIIVLIGNYTSSPEFQISVILALISVLIVSLLLMLGGSYIIKFIPKDVLHAFSRVMAFILAALATQFIIDGIKASFNI